MDIPMLYTGISIVVVICILVLIFLFVPYYQHEDPALKEYQNTVLQAIIEYGYSGDVYDIHVLHTIKIGYKNGVSVSDTVITITMLFPSSFLTNILRPKLRRALLETTCGHSCDICLKV